MELALTRTAYFLRGWHGLAFFILLHLHWPEHAPKDEWAPQESGEGRPLCFKSPSHGNLKIQHAHHKSRGLHRTATELCFSCLRKIYWDENDSSWTNLTRDDRLVAYFSWRTLFGSSETNKCGFNPHVPFTDKGYLLGLPLSLLEAVYTTALLNSLFWLARIEVLINFL